MEIGNANIERVGTLHPYYQPIVREILRRAWQEELYVFVTQAKRAPELQACIYARGRVTAGERFEIAGHTVTTRLEKGKVIASCGKETYVVAAAEWPAIVTKVFWSWHLLGLAFDASFRSSATAKDDLVATLEADARLLRKRGFSVEARHAEAKIEHLYARLDRIAQDVCTDIRWGNDWNQDDIPDSKQGAAFIDMPHYEWHPGKTIDEVRAGSLPPYPKQCLHCRGFRHATVLVEGGHVCLGCYEDGWRPGNAERDCVNGGTR